MSHRADVAVIGGSGFYKIGDVPAELVEIDTPYGPPSDKIALVELSGKRLAFLPRHGSRHTLPPHKVPYRANLWALQSLGVTRVIAPSAVGSLQPHIHPGDFVINDQFVDRTNGRADTYYDGPVATHVSTAEPYCPQLRALAAEAAKKAQVVAHPIGTAVVIQGPRFSTKAESRWFTEMGWHVVTMTQYPEMALARELALCYINISLVTDYDAGIVADAGPVETHDVLKVLGRNTDNARKVIAAILESLPEERTCRCKDSLKFAKIE